MEIKGKEIRELISIKDVTVKPGKNSEEFKLPPNHFFVVVGVAGKAIVVDRLQAAPPEVLISAEKSQALTSMYGSRFVFEVSYEEESEFRAIIFTMLKTSRLTPLKD